MLKLLHIFKNKLIIIPSLIISILIVYQFLPIFYFPYVANDSLWELWHTDLEMYWEWAVYQGRILRYALVWLGTVIVNNNINGMLLLRFLSLLIYIANSILLFYIIYKFIKRNTVFAMLFVVFFNTVQSSQIQLAWADVSIHQILYSLAYVLSYCLVNHLHTKKYNAKILYLVLFISTLVINLSYPICGMMIVSLLSGYILFNFNKDKHLKDVLIIGLVLSLSLVVAKILGDVVININGLIYAESYFKTQEDFIKNTNVLNLIKETVFGALIFGDTFHYMFKININIVIAFIFVVIIVFKDKSENKALKYTLLILAFFFCATGNVLKAYYTLRTVHPVAMIDLFLIFYVADILLKNKKLAKYKKHVSIVFFSLALLFVFVSNISIMRGFIYPRLKEMDFYRYTMINKIANEEVKKGDTIVVVRPLHSNVGVYSPVTGWIEFDTAYSTHNKASSNFLANYWLRMLDLSDDDYSFVYLELAEDEAMLEEYKNNVVIDFRIFSKTEEKYARYILNHGQDTIFK